MRPLTQIFHDHGLEMINEMQAVAADRITARQQELQKDAEILSTLQKSIAQNPSLTFNQSVHAQTSIAYAREIAAKDDTLRSLLSFANDLETVAKMEPTSDNKCRLM